MTTVFSRRTAAALACTTLVLAPASAAPAFAVEADAAGGKTISILSFNDFHGALSAKYTGTQFADTVEDYRSAFEAEHGADSTLLTSAGDLVGASASVSSVQQDLPTIDVMNALGLKVNTAGNHEYDRGLDDLRTRVIPRADFPIISANFVDPQTKEPVLTSHEIVEVDGVRVAVIGASPNDLYSSTTGSGLQGNTVLDMVEAVNGVAAELVAANAADVIVASYHDGASGNGALAAELADDAEFSRMVQNTDPSVDIVFNGHSHQLYQYDTTVGGQYRPVMQAGASGSNLAAVEVTVDAAGEITALTPRMLARSTQDPAAAAAESPVTARVYEIEQRAVAVFKDMQSQVIADLGTDITTDYAQRIASGGTWRAGGTRSAETTLGTWVADALKHAVAQAQPKVDLGVVNAGGLRSELLTDRYTNGGAFAAKPTDLVGKLTLGEVMDVAPFGNTITYFDIPGSSITKALEQNWRDGKRTYTLGWSENLTWTYDDSRPQGEKVTGVWIDGEPLAADTMYTVATQSFLADDTWAKLNDPTKAPDGYTAFAEGRQNFVNLGLIDTQAVADYARAQDTADGAVHADFGKNGVPVTGAPTTVVAGEAVVLTLGDLVIDSDSAPAATAVDVAFVSAAGAVTDLGSVPVPAGQESVTLAGIVAPTAAGAGELRMTVRYADGSSTVVRHALEVTPAATPAPTPKPSPGEQCDDAALPGKGKSKGGFSAAEWMRCAGVHPGQGAPFQGEHPGKAKGAGNGKGVPAWAR